jgi:hypothetical protein
MKASNGNKPAASLLNPGDVKDGDVLLSCGWGKLSKTICLLDGGNYSHSAICAGADLSLLLRGQCRTEGKIRAHQTLRIKIKPAAQILWPIIYIRTQP